MTSYLFEFPTSFYVQQALFFASILNVLFAVMFVPAFAVWRLTAKKNLMLRRVLAGCTVVFVSLLVTMAVGFFSSNAPVNYEGVN